MKIPQKISVEELKKLHDSGTKIFLLDVRNVDEFEKVRVPFATNHPLDQLNLAALKAKGCSPDIKPIYVICRAGPRSYKACEWLFTNGFEDLIDVIGGTNAWVAAGLPTASG